MWQVLYIVIKNISVNVLGMLAIRHKQMLQHNFNFYKTLYKVGIRRNRQ